MQAEASIESQPVGLGIAAVWSGGGVAAVAVAAVRSSATSAPGSVRGMPSRRISAVKLVFSARALPPQAGQRVLVEVVGLRVGVAVAAARVDHGAVAGQEVGLHGPRQQRVADPLVRVVVLGL